MVLPNATERKVLLTCGIVGGFMCALPGEVAGTAILWGLTFIGFFFHKRLLEKEEAAAKQSPPENPADGSAPGAEGAA